MTFGELYRLAQQLHDERSAEAMQLKQANGQLMREMDELKRIMSGLIKAYKDAGGSKSDN